MKLSVCPLPGDGAARPNRLWAIAASACSQGQIWLAQRARSAPVAERGGRQSGRMVVEELDCQVSGSRLADRERSSPGSSGADLVGRAPAGCGYAVCGEESLRRCLPHTT